MIDKIAKIEEGRTKNDEAQKAFDIALNYLSYRSRSRKEMIDYLSRKGFSMDAVELTINKLEDYGYIDDLSFAGSWAKSRLNSKSMSKRMIAYELYRKGIARAVIDQVLESIGEDEEEKAAFALAEKYFKRYEGYEKKERLYKIGQALARRGFEWELIRRICARLNPLQEEGE